MAANRFTEGPWAVRWSRDAGEDGDVHFDIVKQDADADDDGRMVDASYTIVEQAYPVIDTEEALANGHLIAAAPDLYEALFSLVGVVKRSGVGDYEDSRISIKRRVMVAEMALAHARGEAYRIDE